MWLQFFLSFFFRYELLGVHLYCTIVLIFWSGLQVISWRCIATSAVSNCWGSKITILMGGEFVWHHYFIELNFIVEMSCAEHIWRHYVRIVPRTKSTVYFFLRHSCKWYTNPHYIKSHVRNTC